MVLKPATPGFLVTLIGAALLAVVSFGVPILKSVYFLKAQVDLNGQSGIATFGTLGYCLDPGDGNVNCTSPKIGYEFDPNSLLGNKTPIEIPQVVVKWLTYALVLHIVAFGLASIAAVFGLLAHVREMSMTCCSTFVSGFAAAVSLLAFIFDIAFFFLLKARINKVPGGSAQIGNAIWITLAAWILLFFAGCFYSFGRCCISNRPRQPRGRKEIDPERNFEGGQAEAMRLDAIKAEADRKARQKQGEIGLPTFNEYDPTRPLTAKDHEEPYTDHPQRQPSQFAPAVGYGNQPPRRQQSNYSVAATGAGNGYGQAPYAATGGYNDQYRPQAATPPQGHPAAAYPAQPSQYPPNQYNYYAAQPTQPANDQFQGAGAYAAAGAAAGAAGGYAAYAAHSHSQTPPNDGYGHTQYPSAPDSYARSASQGPIEGTYGQGPSGGYGSELYPPTEGQYGHHAQDTSYYSTSSHIQTPSQHEPSLYPAHAAPAATSMGRDDYSFDPKAQTTSRISTNSVTSVPNPYDQPGSSSDARPKGPRSPTFPTSPTRSNPPAYDAPTIPTWPNEKATYHATNQ